MEPARHIAISIRYRFQRHTRAARQKIVGETDTGSDEDVVSYLDAVPNHCLVLDSDSIADLRPTLYKRVITDVAMPSDYRAFHDVGEGPNAGTFAD